MCVLESKHVSISILAERVRRNNVQHVFTFVTALKSVGPRADWNPGYHEVDIPVVYITWNATPQAAKSLGDVTDA